ncbi:MAG TPA: nucleoside-diphosphate kinase [Verrucomicrobiae bacterium]|nr:nucleoside-diphosphate kinase [Verrucomicrobiae bacterium]
MTKLTSKYKTHHLATERTFAMIKPDGVMRGLMGEIIKRLEQRGLKITAMKMVHASFEKADGFYPKDEEWLTRLGNKGIKTFVEYGLDPKKELGSDNPLEVGKAVRKALIEFVTMGPMIPMVVEGLHAVSVVRKIVGSTLPVFADPGTIRGDFAHDAPTSANIENRSIFNLIHASEVTEEAEQEIAHWFSEDEILDYDRADHVIMFGDKRHQ